MSVALAERKMHHGEGQKSARTGKCTMAEAKTPHRRLILTRNSSSHRHEGVHQNKTSPESRRLRENRHFMSVWTKNCTIAAARYRSGASRAPHSADRKNDRPAGKTDRTVTEGRRRSNGRVLMQNPQGVIYPCQYRTLLSKTE